MLKFKRTNNSDETPPLSPVNSPRRPKLMTRLDSADKHKRPSMSLENLAESSSNSSSDGFETPDKKLRDVTKRKLNQEKKKKLKQMAKKEHGFLSSNDFCNMQQELKLWIQETTTKNVSQLSEKKLKDYFKTFKHKWNKRKLPQKYYRGISMCLSEGISLTDLNPSATTECSTGSTHQPAHPPSSDLWITPPILHLDNGFSIPEPMESANGMKTELNVQVANSPLEAKRFATISKSSPRKPSQHFMEEVGAADTKTPPNPPIRSRPPTILTTLNRDRSHSTTNPPSLQPRMGSTVSAIRRPSMLLPPTTTDCDTQELNNVKECTPLVPTKTSNGDGCKDRSAAEDSDKNTNKTHSEVHIDVAKNIAEDIVENASTLHDATVNVAIPQDVVEHVLPNDNKLEISTILSHQTKESSRHSDNSTHTSTSEGLKVDHHCSERLSSEDNNKTSSGNSIEDTGVIQADFQTMADVTNGQNSMNNLSHDIILNAKKTEKEAATMEHKAELSLVKQKSAEKRSRTQSTGAANENCTFISSSQPMAKRKTIWVKDVEDTEEVYV